MPSKNDRWFMFADESGDPGVPGASRHFGYAVLAIERSGLQDFNQARARFRVESGLYGESKSADIGSAGFRAAIAMLGPLIESGRARVGATFITKATYAGPWLIATDTLPRSLPWLRNYLIRKTIEMVFDGVPDIRTTSGEIVMDRARYTGRQIANANRYFRNEFNEGGPFAMPRITDVTQADSLYVEGLQVVDHVSRAVRVLHEKPERAMPLLTEILPSLRIQHLLTAQPVEIHPEAVDGLGR